MAGRPRNPASSTALLAAAVAVLRQRGYEGLVLDEVARIAGTGKSSLYTRFPDRRTLAIAAVGSLQRDPPPPSGDLRLDLIVLLKAAERDLGGLGCGTFGSLLGAGGSGAPSDGASADGASADGAWLLGPYTRRCRRLLASARASGLLRPGADLEVITELLTGGLLVRLLTEGTSSSPWPERTVDAVLGAGGV